MIQHIKTKGFKGFDINEAVHDKTIYTGKNKSGKTSRGMAIALTTLGFIPFAAKVNKKPADILNDFGAGNTLTTSIICNDVEFERHFSKSSKGSVSQRLRVDKKKVSASDFAVALSNAGNPKIIDVVDFMSMSDQKKIDTLFTLYPPKTDLKDLDSKIDKTKSTVNELQARDRATASVIQRLTASKAEIELPAGSLAETKAEIEKLTNQVKEAQDDLKQLEIEQASAEAAENAKTEQKKASQAAFDKIMQENTEPFKAPETKHTREEVENLVDFVKKDLTPQIDREALKAGQLAKQSIHKIINTMLDAGCKTCAALLVAKMELRRFE